MFEIDNLLKIPETQLMSTLQLSPRALVVMAYAKKNTVIRQSRSTAFWTKTKRSGTPGPKNDNYLTGE